MKQQFIILISILWVTVTVNSVTIYAPNKTRECGVSVLSSNANYIMVAKQTDPYYWNNLWINRNADGGNTYAVWDTMENHRRTDGRFQFKALWYLKQTVVYSTLQWIQRNNPTLERQVNDGSFQRLSGTFPSAFYLGLGKSISNRTLMSSDANPLLWESTPIGQFQPFKDYSLKKGIVYDSQSYLKVELYVMSCGTVGQRPDANNKCVDHATAIDTCQNVNELTDWSLFPTVVSNVTVSKCGRSTIQTIVWEAVDSCNISDTLTQVIETFDTTPPSISVLNETITVYGCLSDASIPLPLVADSCSEDVSITFVDVRTPFSNIVTRIWKATDECGNEATVNQTIVIQRSGPSFDILINNINVNSGSTVDANCKTGINLTVSNIDDECDDPSTITVVSTNQTTFENSSCPWDQTITYTITATNSDGFATTKIVKVQLIVNAYVYWFELVKRKITIGCPSYSSIAVPKAKDICGRFVAVEWKDSPPINCTATLPFKTERTYQATSCVPVNNSITYKQTIQVVDRLGDDN
jgi:hypothetical protein